MVAIPSFQGVPRMKGIRHCRCGPRPHLLGSIVERPDDCLRRQVCVEGDDIPNGAHPSIRPARRSEERLLRILEDFRSLQCDEALAFHRSPVWLTLRSEERPTVIRDLERDPHARNISRWIYRPDVPGVRVVLVEPKNEGNVGAVARAMKNFDVHDLVLVNPCALGPEARQRAMHGADILESATVVPDLTSAIQDADLIIGTSGIDTSNEKRFARIAVSPSDLAIKLGKARGTTALLFGREDFGLLEEELLRCDLLVTIPAAKPYPILNLSHAATVLLYELFNARAPTRPSRTMSGLEKEKLHSAFADLLDATDYPAHKIGRTRIMFRRMMGRAVPSGWEFHALMGVLQRATKRIRRLEGKR